MSTPNPPPATAYRDPASVTTRFFRNKAQLAELVSRVIPALWPDPDRPLTALVIGGSAGCEALSLVASLADAAPARPLHVLSTDRQQHVLTAARAARYSPEYFQPIYGNEGGTPPDLLARWFTPHHDPATGEAWHEPLPSLRSRVTYEPFDLLSSPLPGRFDLVLCQNILTHLQPDAARAGLDRAIDCVASPGALLCAGMDLDLRPHIVARGLHPWTGSLDAIHDGWESHRMHFRQNRGRYYFELEDIDRSHPDFPTRYASIFTRTTPTA